MASQPVALILGAGPRVGASVADKFAKLGYKIALASRQGTGGTSEKGYLSLKADCTNPASIPALFNDVSTKLGVAPSVVVYNAAALSAPADQSSALSIPIESFAADLNVNTVSAYAAAQEAVRAWATLPREVKKTFIYTGNRLNVAVAPVPLFLNLGVGKAASAYWLAAADALYSSSGYRFFYADERRENGSSPSKDLDGPAHAEFFAELASHPEAVPWHATFVKAKGYARFN